MCLVGAGGSCSEMPPPGVGGSSLPELHIGCLFRSHTAARHALEPQPLDSSPS